MSRSDGRVDLTSADGHVLGAHLAGPADAEASVVVVQEIFGVNSHIRSVVDLYGSLGYRAIAPALFDRVERDVELDYDTAGAAAGAQLRNALAWSSAVADVAAAVEHVRRVGKVGAVGFCYGGGVAWLAANELDIDAAVAYYGGQIRQFVERSPRCPTMLHFGGTDHMIPAEDIDVIRAAHPDVPVFVYEQAGHGFNCDVRDAYDPAAALLAQRRTNDFLAIQLAPERR